MTTWKRDFTRGLIVLVPVLVTGFVLYFVYGFAEGLTPEFLLPERLLNGIIANDATRELVTELLRVTLSMSVLIGLIYASGSLMRTAAGSATERLIDTSANLIPGVRVVYNASKTAAETAVGDQKQLQKPVKFEVWDGLRMTAFKTGQTTADGRELYFIPTSPNITTGFLVEADSHDVTSLDETAEDALTRVLSAGFGDSNRNAGTENGIPNTVVNDSAANERDGQ